MPYRKHAPYFVQNNVYLGCVRKKKGAHLIKKRVLALSFT